jgi:hypothetical protein
MSKFILGEFSPLLILHHDCLISGLLQLKIFIQSIRWSALEKETSPMLLVAVIVNGTRSAPAVR